MGFGAIMMWEVWRYASYGWIERYYIDPSFYFKYYGFSWVHPWPGIGMYVHFAVLAVLAAMIFVGIYYRLAAVGFFFAFTYIFLLDQTRYLNHFYLVSLISAMLIVLPAHRIWSLDAVRSRKKRKAPKDPKAPDTVAPPPGMVPAWAIWAIRAQLGVVYTYAAFAKMNADWLRLAPMARWLKARDDIFIIGPLFNFEITHIFFAYGGLFFDLLVAPALIWRRTRVFAFIICVCFHLTNHILFSIGIFPWFMMVATLIFFAPDWPRRALRFLLKRLAPAAGLQVAPAEPAAPAATSEKAAPKNVSHQPSGTERAGGPGLLSWSQLRTSQRGIVLLGAVWFTLQLTVPFRHLLYPGNANWTEEGHRFSWHMKLREKRGTAVFVVTDPKSGQVWEVQPRAYLDRKQARRMATRPDMTLQFAHFLRDQWREEHGLSEVEVRVEAQVSLNGRKRDLLIDPSRDLAKVERNLAHADWILPLSQPLPK